MNERHPDTTADAMLIALVVSILGSIFVATISSPRPPMLPGIPKFVINLDTRPERMNAFLSQWSRSDLAKTRITRIPAVNGMSVDLDAIGLSAEVKRDMLESEKAGKQGSYFTLTRGALGCYYSHVSTWKTIAAGDSEYALVFEDDAEISQNLGETISVLFDRCAPQKDWDMFLLGRLCTGCRPHRDDPNIYVVDKFMLTHAYAITKKCAEFFLSKEDLLPPERQIDLYLTDRIRLEGVRVMTTKDPTSHQTDIFPTDVQTLATEQKKVG